MQSFHIALAIESVEDGKYYKQQPLHCTLMHWFSVDEVHEDSVLNHCSRFFQAAPSVDLLVEGVEMFGDDKDVPVFVVQKTNVLYSLHEGLLSRLQPLGFVPSEPQYVAGGYRPHVTPRSSDDLRIGQTVRSRVSYVSLRTSEMNPPGTRGNSQILRSFSLK